MTDTKDIWIKYGYDLAKKEFQEKIEKFKRIFNKDDKDTIWSSAVVYFEFKQIFGEEQ